jgi:hypothetical protein
MCEEEKHRLYHHTLDSVLCFISLKNHPERERETQIESDSDCGCTDRYLCDLKWKSTRQRGCTPIEEAEVVTEDSEMKDVVEHWKVLKLLVDSVQDLKLLEVKRHSLYSQVVATYQSS